LNTIIAAPLVGTTKSNKPSKIVVTAVFAAFVFVTY